MNPTSYAYELVSLKVAPLLMPLFPNFKEVSESFAAFRAVREHLAYNTRDSSVSVIAVGDGSTPRTAATFALRTSWTAYSIDPALRREHLWKRSLKRVVCDPRRIEETHTRCKQAIVIAVHSHANLRAAVRSVEADSIAVVAMPCCVAQDLDTPPDVEYEDFGCLSPRRTVRIWRNVSSS